jgi:hypothetical protein
MTALRHPSAIYPTEQLNDFWVTLYVLIIAMFIAPNMSNKLLAGRYSKATFPGFHQHRSTNTHYAPDKKVTCSCV